MMKRWISLSFIMFICLFPQTVLAEDDNGSVLDAYRQSSTDEADISETEPNVEITDQSEQPVESEPSLFEGDNEEVSFWGLVIRFLLALTLVVVLIYVLLKLMNKFTSKQGQLNNLENLGGVSVGMNKSVQLVKVGTKVYLLGVGDTVELLTEITDQTFIDQLTSNNQVPGADLFSKVTQSFQQKQSKSDDNSSPNMNGNDSFSTLFKGELEQMKQKQAKIRQDIKGHDLNE
ncbi:flagellar protein FliO/FliZ [Halolactibacillus halophilus]|uniref:Flagellar protein FliO/FliZ n=2 Tax=Halolactibacillus halophilus TaxID=306540 RepID=A0A1I5LLI5_9BACI|nr:flagellar protein FliO/FliZ [Halolactibacillus halophilus]